MAEVQVARSFYLLSVERRDGAVALSRYDWLQNRSLPQLLELSKSIKAKPLYAVHVKLKKEEFVPFIGNYRGSEGLPYD